MDHSIFTHNGTLTLYNPATEGHRTLRVRTQPEDAKFAPGERIVALLVGPDNENSYQPFAFLKPDGRVLVWKRYRGNGEPSRYEKLARMLTQPELFEAKGVQYEFSTTCRRCNRKLTTPASIASGIGPVCESLQ